MEIIEGRKRPPLSFEIADTVTISRAEYERLKEIEKASEPKRPLRVYAYGMKNAGKKGE